MGNVIKEKPEMLAKVNAAIQCVAKVSGSSLVKELIAVQLNPNSADYQFGATLDVFATPTVSGAEISTIAEDRLADCVRVRIIHAMEDMKDLLDTHLDLLRGN